MKLCQVVRRKADTLSLAQNFSRARHGNIILAKMDAIKVGAQAQVRPVIHDELRPAAQLSFHFAPLAQYLARRTYLVTILHQSSARACQFCGKGCHFAHVAAKARCIHDGVEARQLHAIFS